MYVEVRPKHNWTMVPDASPGTADPKMNKSFVHTAQMSSDRACTQDGYFECPHPTIIDGDKRSTVVGLCWFWSWWTFDTQLARQNLGKNNTPQPWWPPSPYGRHGAPPPAPPHTTISQHAVQQVYVVKTKEYICYYYLFAI